MGCSAQNGDCEIRWNRVLDDVGGDLSAGGEGSGVAVVRSLASEAGDRLVDAGAFAAAEAAVVGLVGIAARHRRPGRHSDLFKRTAPDRKVTAQQPARPLLHLRSCRDALIKSVIALFERSPDYLPGQRQCTPGPIGTVTPRNHPDTDPD